MESHYGFNLYPPVRKTERGFSFIPILIHKFFLQIALLPGCLEET